MAPTISTLVYLALLAGVTFFVPSATAFNHQGLKRETNGGRLARGLVPLRPRRLYDATRTGPALARRSVTPLMGLLTAFDPSDLTTPVCYFTSTSTCDSDITNAVQFISTGSPGDITPPQDLDVISAGFTTYNLIMETNSAVIQGPGSSTYGQVVLANNFHTAPYASPGVNPADSKYAESAIWQIAVDGTVTATWVNAPASVPPTVPLQAFYGYNTGPLYLTGDPAVIGMFTGYALVLKIT